MRILFSSHVFAPSVGGIETVSRLLTREFVRMGHEVRLITQTPGDSQGEPGFEIHRRPSAAQLLGLVRWCDVFFHNNISLPRAWPLLFVRRPWVVAHHTWIPRSGLAARVKRYMLRHATRCISVSSSIASHLETPSTVIPNPYDDSLFRKVEDIPQTRDLIFLGRLVSDKGADLLLSAVATLARDGLHPTLTIVGGGAEEASLRSQAEAAGLSSTVSFAGTRSGVELVELLNRHRILVIPSRWEEPFGIVALEGTAAGCVVVGSDRGGLPEAIGTCGEVFPSGDGKALASVLATLLRDPVRYAALRGRAERHLHRHSCSQIASEYLRTFAQALTTAPSRPRAQGISDV